MPRNEYRGEVFEYSRCKDAWGCNVEKVDGWEFGDYEYTAGFNVQSLKSPFRLVTKGKRGEVVQRGYKACALGRGVARSGLELSNLPFEFGFFWATPSLPPGKGRKSFPFV